MSGRELEQMLTLIDENIEMNDKRVWREIMDYIRDHEEDAVHQLSTTQSLTVPTFIGPRSISLKQLKSITQ
jgi:hypothetical protein